MKKHTWKEWLVFAAGWLAATLFFSLLLMVNSQQLDKALDFGQAFLISLAEWLAAALLSPLVVRLAERFRISYYWRPVADDPFNGLNGEDRPGIGNGLRPVRWWIALPVYILGAAGFCLAQLGLNLLLDWLVELTIGSRYTCLYYIETLLGPAAMTPGNIIRIELSSDGTIMCLIYLLIVAYSYGREYYQRFREREFRALQLEASLSKARLEALRMQLQPHFLFNTLNATAALIHTDPEAADLMLTRLSSLLRITLDRADVQLVPLEEELRFLTLYLEIEKVRFQDRLTVVQDIEPAALTAPVPYMILQPIVENAIRHGISRKPGQGRLNVRVCLENGCLRLEVADDGIGLAAAAQTGHRPGVGLSNVRARLQQLYGDSALLALVDNPGGGTRVIIKLPVRRSSSSVFVQGQMRNSGKLFAPDY